jgi:hypothetical protein
MNNTNKKSQSLLAAILLGCWLFLPTSILPKLPYLPTKLGTLSPKCLLNALERVYILGKGILNYFCTGNPFKSQHFKIIGGFGYSFDIVGNPLILMKVI